MKSEDFSDLISMVSQRLKRERDRNDGILHEGVIERQVDRELSFEDYDVDRDAVIAELERNFATLIGVATSLHSQEKNDLPEAPWVAQRLTDHNLKWAFWLRYRDFLLKESWPEPVVSRMDQITTDILDSMMPPDSQSSWDQRGLVVGHVQSGKTANYTGLICKAVDAGYKVIIILAGAHNNLRSQTQIRIEEGFLGYGTIDEDITVRYPLGVGLSMPIPQNADSITTRGEKGDFRTPVANHFSIHPGGNPLVFIVKKYSSVLENLLKWVLGCAKLKGHDQLLNTPLLMIDDESDYASVDTGKQEFDEYGNSDNEHNPKAINRWIRRILKAFSQSVYIGYTATPFANIFIHEGAKTTNEGEDLFPRSFIFSLPAASNYVGPVKMFGLDNGIELPIFREVSDHADSYSLRERNGWMPPLHQKNHSPMYLGNACITPSLEEAIQCFILATAARKARGQDKSHNSMLIHITRFVDLQKIVKEQVENYFFKIRNRIIYGDGERESILDDLQGLWEKDFVVTSAALAEEDCIPVSWDQVREKLQEAVQSITVREINGTSADILEYKKRSDAGIAFDVIAIGGNKLSRGLTLEGLTVSYFLRHSKMYDTLMQMGRWFGYRPGYLDTCRIYTTEDLWRWFRHISKASEELREDFNRMVLSGCTPRQFGHRVMNHPQMMVTSPVKMRNTEKRTTSFDGYPVETIIFGRNPEVVESNFKALQNLTKKIMDDTTIGLDSRTSHNKYVWRGVSPEHIIDFLKSYKAFSATNKARPEYLRQYIEKQNSRDMLMDWTVYIVQGELLDIEIAPGCNPKMIKRTWFKRPENPGISDPYRVRRSGNPADEYIDLDEEQVAEALDKSIRMWEASDSARSENPPSIPRGPAIRETRNPKKGLLCLYPIEAQVSPGCPALEKPLIGFMFSFPGDSNALPIQYVVNEVFMRQESGGFWDE